MALALSFARTMKLLSMGILFYTILSFCNAKDTKSSSSSPSKGGSSQTYQSALKSSGFTTGTVDHAPRGIPTELHTGGSRLASMAVLTASSKDTGIRPPLVIDDSAVERPVLRAIAVPSMTEQQANLDASTMSEFTKRSGSTSAQVGGSQDLPVGWTAIPDASTGRFYYWNTLTNEVTWDQPTQPELPVDTPAQQEQMAQDVPTQPEENDALVAQNQPEMKPDQTSQDLPEGWQAIPDPVSGYLYFWNRYTNEVSWEIPESPASNAASEVPIKQQNNELIQPLEGTAFPVSPVDLPDGWKSYEDTQSQSVFYWNDITSEAWQAIFDQASGMYYYWNPATSETTFSIPASLTRPKVEEISFQLPPGTVIDMSNLEKTLSNTPSTEESAPSPSQKTFVPPVTKAFLPPPKEKTAPVSSQKTSIPPTPSVPSPVSSQETSIPPTPSVPVIKQPEQPATPFTDPIPYKKPEPSPQLVPTVFNDLWNQAVNSQEGEQPAEPTSSEPIDPEPSVPLANKPETTDNTSPDETSFKTTEEDKPVEEPSFEAPIIKTPTPPAASEPEFSFKPETAYAPLAPLAPKAQTPSQSDQSKSTLTLDLQKLKDRETLLSNRDAGVLPGFTSSSSSPAVSSVKNTGVKDTGVAPITNNLGWTNKESTLQALKVKDMIKSIEPSAAAQSNSKSTVTASSKSITQSAIAAATASSGKQSVQDIAQNYKINEVLSHSNPKETALLGLKLREKEGSAAMLELAVREPEEGLMTEDDMMNFHTVVNNENQDWISSFLELAEITNKHFISSKFSGLADFVNKNSSLNTPFAVLSLVVVLSVIAAFLARRQRREEFLPI